MKLSVLDKTISCRCGKNFCAKHRLPESHECKYDYKQDKVMLVSIQTEKVPPI
jgi:predicted nucleic acid binding AN1-type Zn finger protein